MRWRVLRHQSGGLPIEGILVLPPEGLGDQADGSALVPMLVVPHGGPHSCTPTDFIPSYAYLAHQLHCAVLHTNYRGSTGFGEAGVLALPGECGNVDLTDVMALVEEARKFPMIHPERLGIVGGSHGGFLVGHAIGQYPEAFQVCVAPLLLFPFCFEWRTCRSLCFCFPPCPIDG